MIYKVGERVSLEMQGMLGRDKKSWNELSTYEQSAWMVYDEHARIGCIWEEE